MQQKNGTEMKPERKKRFAPAGGPGGPGGRGPGGPGRGPGGRFMEKPKLKDSKGTILRLLGYINGALDDESDDAIDDCELYNLFVNLLGRIGEQLPTEEELGRHCDEELAQFTERIPDSRRRVKDVLMVMVYAYFSANAKRRVDMLMKEIRAAT